jgi:lipid-binding SYLF domain-containing protein
LQFLTVIKVGFVFTGRVGTGLVVARLPDGRWSAPSAIATAGVGWGAQIGGEITDFVIILNTKRTQCLHWSLGVSGSVMYLLFPV